MTSRRIGFALALLAWFGFGAARWESENPFDFYQFWMIGQGAVEAKGDAGAALENVYAESGQRLLIDTFRERAVRSGSPAELEGHRVWASGMAPTATPLLYTTVAFLSSGEFDRDARRFRLLSLAVYVAGVAALALAAGLPAWAALAAVFGFTQLFWPFHVDVADGNVSQLQVGAVAALAFLLRLERRAGDLGAGALGALLLLFKPTVLFSLGLVTLAWLIGGRARRLVPAGAGALAGIVIGVALPPLVLGRACTWSQWRESALAPMLGGQHLGGGLVDSLFGVVSLPIVLMLALPLFAFGAALTARAHLRRRAAPGARPARDPHSELAFLAIGLALYLLSGPIVHAHYFLLAVPLAIFALRPGQRAWRYPTALGATALLASQPQLRALGLSGSERHSLWSFLGVAILLLLALGSLLGRRRAPVEGAPSERIAA